MDLHSGVMTQDACNQVRHQRGFTLLEVLVVIAVMGLGVGIVLSHGRTHGGSMDWHAAVDQVARGLRMARSKAIIGNHAVRLTFDLEANRFTVENGSFVILPRDLAISITAVEEEVARRRFASIRFNGDGSASGGRIELAEGQRKAVIAVDWLTGRITIKRL